MAAHQYRGQKRSLEESSPDPGEEGSSQPAKRQCGNKTSNDGQASSHSAPTVRILLPKPSDLPQTLKMKLTAIVRTLRSGQSIASATCFAATPNHTRDPIAKAKQEMHPTELWMWNTYMMEPTVKLTVIDWTLDVEPNPTTKKALQNAERRAEALNRLYETDQAQPGHAVWFTRNLLPLLPLVKAMERVIGAEKDIGCGTKGLLKADLQTLNAILGTVGSIVSKGTNKIDGGVLGLVQSVLGAERQRLRALLR
ncbi:MAG: hypothetical protein Q9204_004778 [Flavoplaca sp. TL-2023a]